MGVSQTLTVVVPAGPPPTTVPVLAATTLPGTPVTATLPRTGAPLLPLLVAVAVALVLAGRLLVMASKRMPRPMVPASHPARPEGDAQVDRT